MSLQPYRTAHRRRESGQTLLLFVFFVVMLVMFLGMAIDLGFAYITKAELSKGVDAACLAGMLDLGQGQAQAELIAKSTFYTNYTMTNHIAGSVTLSVTNSVDGCTIPNRYITVNASVSMNTYFLPVMKVLPGSPDWSTLPISDSATATRQHLIVCLVLDRSGSMNPLSGTTKGGLYLADCVTDFISNFVENYDQAAMVSFATTATTDFPMSNVFKAAITNAANNLDYIGGTFSPGGLALGLGQLAAATNQAPQCENAIYAVVFFTDGKANMIQQNLSCPPSTPWVFGGYDTDNYVGFWPTGGVTTAEQNCPDCLTVNGGTPVPQTPNCQQNCCTLAPVTCYPSQTYFITTGGSQASFLRANVTMEAETEGAALALTMQKNGWLVYSIGLASDPNNTVNSNFLYEVANDPNSPTFNNHLPQGEALITSDPTQLKTLFDQVAQAILLRLTQ